MLKTLLKSVRQYKKESLLSPLCVAVEVFIEMYIPYIMGQLIDNGVNKGDMDYVRRLGFYTIVLTLISLALGRQPHTFPPTRRPALLPTCARTCSTICRTSPLRTLTASPAPVW